MNENGQLGQAWRDGKARWPRFALSYDEFAAHVGGLRERAGRPHDEDLAQNAADLFLAAACVARIGPALTTLNKEYLSRTPAMIAAIDRSDSFAAEVAQVLRERLLCPPLDRLRHYAGTGTLGGWLRVAARRAALDLKRREGVSLKRIGNLPTAVSGAAHGPEWELLQRRYRGPLETALRAALAELPPRDRMVLRLCLVGGESIDNIGRIYGVHRATAARWVVSARRTVVDATIARLGQDLKLSPRDCRSLARELRSHIDVTLDGLL